MTSLLGVSLAAVVASIPYFLIPIAATESRKIASSRA